MNDSDADNKAEISLSPWLFPDACESLTIKVSGHIYLDRRHRRAACVVVQKAANAGLLALRMFISPSAN
jgi:hypothetical protein